jgi:hypothetical protein
MWADFPELEDGLHHLLDIGALCRVDALYVKLSPDELTHLTQALKASACSTEVITTL